MQNTRYSTAVEQYRKIEELALINFELLLSYWGIEYKKINVYEYDFLNPTRDDKNYGACRFNTLKNKGADFAGIAFTEDDYKLLGPSFTKEDFTYTPKAAFTNWGFNVIGLCQRLHNCDSYKDAAKLIMRHLAYISQDKEYQKATEKVIEEREKKLQEANFRKLKSAEKIWNICKSIEGTLGEFYLQSRAIFLPSREDNIRYHPRIMNKEIERTLPALLFKVAISPDSPLVAIQRIYLNPEGTGKAQLENQKISLGTVKGAAIWFGSPCEKLDIAEGPENALSLRCMGNQFTASTINSANFGNLTIPSYVKTIVLHPDPDKAGIEAAKKAIIEYKKTIKNVKIILPDIIENKKNADLNDVLQYEYQRGKINDGRETKTGS